MVLYSGKEEVETHPIVRVESTPNLLRF